MAEKQSDTAPVPVGQKSSTASGPQSAGTTTLLGDLRSALQLGDPR